MAIAIALELPLLFELALAWTAARTHETYGLLVGAPSVEEPRARAAAAIALAGVGELEPELPVEPYWHEGDAREGSSGE